MTSITTLYKQYIDVFPQEAAALEPLRRQLADKGEQGITSRKTFDTGHMTAGTIVVSLPSKRVLLIDHAVLRKSLQPGGHVEQEDESPLATAYRECEEEAGLPASALRYIALADQSPELPFAITVRDIPANSAKNEPAHHHYDCWYLFTVPDGTEAHPDNLEVTNPQWTPFTTFAENTEFSRHAEKINKLLATS